MATVYVIADSEGAQNDGQANRRAKDYAQALGVPFVEIASKGDRKKARAQGVRLAPAIVVPEPDACVVTGGAALDALAKQLRSTVDGAADLIRIDSQYPPRVAGELAVQKKKKNKTSSTVL